MGNSDSKNERGAGKRKKGDPEAVSSDEPLIDKPGDAPETSTSHDPQALEKVQVEMHYDPAHFGTSKPDAETKSLGDERTSLPLSKKKKKNECEIVAAIDFGSTWFGYAYSFREDPYTIHTDCESKSGETFSTVLLGRDKRIHAIGRDAWEKWGKLMPKEHQDWFLLDHFKKKLFYMEGIKEEEWIEDRFGKQVLALEVFSAAIDFLTSKVIEEVNKEPKPTQVSKADIHWVLVVQARGSDASKQFMRKAAERAGVDDDLLTITTESEATALFCRRTELSGLDLKLGKKYLVLDLQSGASGLIAHEIDGNSSLRELYHASDTECVNKGKNAAHATFDRILGSLYQPDTGTKLKHEFPREYVDLLIDFEQENERFQGEGKGDIVLKLPPAVSNFLQELNPEKKSPKEKQCDLVITKVLMKDCFVKCFVEQTKALLKNQGVNDLILVGGLLRCPYLLKKMNQYLKHVTYKEPPAAVLKGAVLYGHDSTLFAQRVCRYTYGIRKMMILRPEHNEGHKIKQDEKEYCDFLFNKHIEMGQIVQVGKDVYWKEYYPPINKRKYIERVVLEVYASTDKNPTYVTEESCWRVAEIRIDFLGNTSEIDWGCEVGFRYDESGLTVAAKGFEPSTALKARIDFL